MKMIIIMMGIFLAGCRAEETSHPPVEEMKEASIVDAPHLSQLPELERGCEVTTLAMLLQHAGVDVGKMELAEKIDRVPFEQEGLNGHPRDGFVGNMETMDEPGLGVYYEPILELAETYLPGGMVDLTGKPFDKVEEAIVNERPVWVLVTSTFNVVPDEEWETWQTEHGEIDITYSWHSVLVTGFDEEYVYVNDPLEHKNTKHPKEAFIAGWEQFGSQAVSYKDH